MVIMFLFRKSKSRLCGVITVAIELSFLSRPSSWHRSANLGRRFVLTQTLVNHLPQQVVFGPGEITDLGDQLGPHPMHAAEHQGRAEPAGARRRDLERHIGRSEGPQATPPPVELCTKNHSE